MTTLSSLYARSSASAALAALAAIASPAASAGLLAAQDKAAAAKPAPSEERLREAWSFLLPQEQQDAANYLRESTRHLESFQQSLIDFALGLEPRDPSQLPSAPPTPFYAPEVHAPRQPIARQRLDEDDARAKKQRAKMLSAVPKTGLDSAWRYDWASREVQRCGDDLDPTRVFFNALAGYPPDLDLGQALIERALDDGAQQAALAAFSYAYTDRSGFVYPGLTLYDAWCSATEMEMPDVDVLGVIHTLAQDWKSWVAPVPDSQHDDLYAKVFTYFQPAKRHRGLRTALAMTFLSGSIPLRDGYLGHRDRFHSYWDEQGSLPDKIAAQLPDSEGWAAFLEKWSERIDNDTPLTLRGQTRRATLDQDAERVRAIALAILKEFGALERKSRPAPPPPRVPEEGKK